MAGGLLKPKFPIPGGDFAGIVAAVGKNVQQFQPADEVFGDRPVVLSDPLGRHLRMGMRRRVAADARHDAGNLRLASLPVRERGASAFCDGA